FLALGSLVGLRQHRIDGPQGLGAARDQVGEFLTGRQRPFEGRADTQLQPAAQRLIERIGKHRQQPLTLMYHHAVAAGGIRRGQHREIRLELRQLAAGDEAVIERAGECPRIAIAGQAAALRQHLEDRALRLLRLLHGARDRGLIDQHSGRGGDCGRRAPRGARSACGGGSRHRRLIEQLIHRGVHLMLPASWKIGKYMSTTITPMINPITIMSTGSIRRVITATQRASSSSKKSAMRSIISPMLPLRSPTRSMRAATAVVRPLRSIASASDCPSVTARVAAAYAARAPASTTPPDMRSAGTAGIPPRTSMPTVR